MAGRNRKAAEKFATFEERFKTSYEAGAVKVSRTFGKRIQKQRLAQIGPLMSKRRKDGVTFRVTRRGALILLDLAPIAAQQEYGRVITPQNGEFLRVPIGGGDNRKQLDDDGSFVVKTKNGLLVMRPNGDGTAEAIATLRTRVVIKRNDADGRFATIVDANLRSYKDQLAEEIIKGFYSK